jgi:hypothetical protein
MTDRLHFDGGRIVHNLSQLLYRLDLVHELGGGFGLASNAPIF